MHGDLRDTWSALLPMGGAVSGVAGPNWVLVGDAAGCVNPLNGEGIDYGLETGRLAVNYSRSGFRSTLRTLWPLTLRHHYGPAFSIARRLAGLLTVPGFLPKAGPVGMRSQFLMRIALRVMGNLITPRTVTRSRGSGGRRAGLRCGSTTGRRSADEAPYPCCLRSRRLNAGKASASNTSVIAVRIPASVQFMPLIIGSLPK